MTSPLVSVVMPVWNGERYLREAIDSILNQTFQDFEFIILDDGSTDSTPSILDEYQARDPRVKVIKLAHEGIVIALNRGVAESRGELIARMDCDDIAYPDRFARQVAALQADPAASLCHTSIRHIGDTRLIRSAGRFIRSRALMALRLCHHSPIVHPTVMFRKKAFLEAGGYLPEERHAEDYGLWGRLLAAGPVCGLPEALLDFRIHGESISKVKAEIQEQLTRVIAVRHCKQFANLSDEEATRAYEVLRGDRQGNALRDWAWFVCRCAPRFKWQSLEMWAWLGSRTLRLTMAAIRKPAPPLH